MFVVWVGSEDEAKAGGGWDPRSISELGRRIRQRNGYGKEGQYLSGRIHRTRRACRLGCRARRVRDFENREGRRTDPRADGVLGAEEMNRESTFSTKDP